MPIVELVHIPCRHMVKEYEGRALYSSVILKLELLPLPYSLGASFCSHRVTYIKGSYKGVPYQVHKPITFTLQKRSHRVTLQWQQEAHDDFRKD